MLVSSESDGSKHAGWERDAVSLLAGAVDLGLEQAEGVLRRIRGVLGRSDLKDFVADGHRDLKARGELALGRYVPSVESHMEALARQAISSRPDLRDV